jgi:hypothetical protein
VLLRIYRKYTGGTQMKSKTKLELLEEMVKLEQATENMKLNLSAVNSYYFKYGEFTIDIRDTDDFKHHGTDSPIPFDKEVMEDYLETHIAHNERLLIELHEKVSKMTL